MLIYRIFLVIFSLGMPLVTLLVGGRLLWCTYQLARIRRYALAIVSAVACLGLGGLLFLVAFSWLEYEVLQTGRELWTDLRMDLITGVPFYGAAFALWRLSASLASVVHDHRLDRIAELARSMK